ncbi:hypothetical protein N7457_004088 [Penicillium paradoxum]|uniref:uncharacterized protein n=1 Tax=Penicillium paradoxum TaxID=176176 RepID=UPI00254850E9|nr:uncharacterized protein N7457_004088 [Penicillium paradoxum]KAJ5782314.1 hypothetical protein N7457_004088 [Penicillium paradoxum]
MAEVHVDPAVFAKSAGKTVLITGAARGIGAATAIFFNDHGANVILADLPHLQDSAEEVINKQIQFPERAIFVAADIVNWAQLTACFEAAISKFGNLDIVVANAGIMESKTVLDLDVDEDGHLLENEEAGRVIDVNIKGTLNSNLSFYTFLQFPDHGHTNKHETALRLGLHYMKSPPNTEPKPNKSILLVGSTSSYFGGTAVTAYIASKHAMLGLLRACQRVACGHGIRVNGVAPFLTPTHITAGFSDLWIESGLETNTLERVAETIALVALDTARQGDCVLVAGRYRLELEKAMVRLLPLWLGEDLGGFMGYAMQFLANIGGYVLPKRDEPE